MDIQSQAAHSTPPNSLLQVSQSNTTDSAAWNSILTKYSSGSIDTNGAIAELSQAEGLTSAPDPHQPLVATLTETERSIRFSLLKELMAIGDDETDKKVQDKYAEDNILYGIPEGTEAAEVDPYWNAENTSQRLVDFAISFRSYFTHMDDVEFLEEVKAAMLEGYARAHEDMGFTDETIPPDLGKLYNDTYHSTMDKIDTLLTTAKQEVDQS
ncbi:MAG: hypothetical protein OCC49_02815 [Fibrobacterales bacterium]